LIGTVAPPLIEFRVPKPSTGAAKPANWNATVTVNPPVARLPAASAATQVTWVVPGANGRCLSLTDTNLGDLDPSTA
jgi:hypothetical protein